MMSATEPDHDPSASTPEEAFDADEPTTATHYSLSRAVHARKSEYVRPHRIRVKIGTWNVAGCPGTDKDIDSWFIAGDGLEPKLNAGLMNLGLSEDSIEAKTGTGPQHASVETHQAEEKDESKAQSTPGGDTEEPTIRAVGGDKIGLYVLGLQEIVNLNRVHQSFYSDASAVAKWQDALEAALPKDYTLVASQQLVGLLLLIYASPEVAPTISNESTLSMGTGLLGYMGNKGAVVSRLLLGETTRLVFSNCHLASGHDQTSLDRRCWDYNKIMTNTAFSPISRAGVSEDEGDKMGDEDFTFFFGDLNFRLDGLPGNDIRHLLTLHSRGEYDVSNTPSAEQLGEESVFVLHDNEDETSDGTSTPTMVSRETSFDRNGESDESSEELPDPDDFEPDPHNDPASLQATLDSLLPHDQLQQVIKSKKAFHEGWREGPITFLPTYKYDVGTVGLFDTSEKKRAPSWCDRILFRTRKDIKQHKKQLQDQLDAKIRDDDLKKRGIEQAAEDENVLFDYDPTADSSTDQIASRDAAYDYDDYNEDEDNMEQVTTRDGFVDEISLDLYTSHQRVMSSDHKPLVAVFTLQYDAVVPELKAKVHAEVARELDRVENEGRPGITIVVDGSGAASANEGSAGDGSSGVEFGDVGFLRKKSRSLTIANTGRVQAKLQFLEKPRSDDDDDTQTPSWLGVQFATSLNDYDERKREISQAEISLDPGDTINAVIEVEVHDLKQLRALNENPTQLEDVLVLRVVDGRDHFIPIRASWQPSCFGRSLEELIRIPKGGITTLIKQRPRTGSIPYSLDVHGSSPTELFKLIEAIESLAERLIADENMIEEVYVPREKAGWPFDRQTWTCTADNDYAVLRGDIVEALENGKPVLEALRADVPALKRLEIVAEALVLFLESMQDGIIAETLWKQIETALPQLGAKTTAAEVEDVKTGVLDSLSASPYHNISFVFLMAMLSRVAGELLPLGKEEREVLSGNGNGSGSGSGGINGSGGGWKPVSLGKRSSLSLRRRDTNSGSGSGGGSGSGSGSGSIDELAIQRRLAWERRTAEVMGVVICRAPGVGVEGVGDKGDKGREKERKAAEEKMRALVEVFMRRDGP
ncbi:type II inositol-1,4,5-trisphosphate 5-phosphatase [Astrocystis sublimbata]|nr:type II inositol-1,4,5-trisphosphate 5-phosphatase [Astrocystis sublimbata]